MKLSPHAESFVFHFGEMGSRWGFNRTVGQLFALLVINEHPLCADDLTQALSISRGNVSMGLKELQSWQLVRRVHQPGERKEFYASADNVWDMAIKVLEERRKRELDPTLSLLRSLLLDADNSSTETYAHDRIKEIHDLLELIANWSNDLQHLNPDNLRSLMKLGAGVSKVLDFKGKLLK